MSPAMVVEVSLHKVAFKKAFMSKVKISSLYVHTHTFVSVWLWVFISVYIKT